MGFKVGSTEVVSNSATIPWSRISYSSGAICTAVSFPNGSYGFCIQAVYSGGTLTLYRN